MLEKPISHLEELWRDTQFTKAMNGDKVDAFDKLARMYDMPRPQWIPVKNWRNAMRATVYGARGVFWQVWQFLEQALDAYHETLGEVVVPEPPGWVAGQNPGTNQLNLSSGTFTNAHVGRFVRLVPKTLADIKYQVSDDVGSVDISHPLLRQHPILVYTECPLDASNKHATQSAFGTLAAPTTVDKMKVSKDGLFGTKYQIRELDVHRLNNLSENELLAHDQYVDFIPKGTYTAKFLGFSIEEQSKAKIKIVFYKYGSTVPATYIQKDVLEEWAPDGAQFPSGGHLQENVFESGNQLEGPFPIYLEGLGSGQADDLSKVLHASILPAGVTADFEFRTLKDYPDS